MDAKEREARVGDRVDQPAYQRTGLRARACSSRPGTGRSAGRRGRAPAHRGDPVRLEAGAGDHSIGPQLARRRRQDDLVGALRYPGHPAARADLRRLDRGSRRRSPARPPGSRRSRSAVTRALGCRPPPARARGSGSGPTTSRPSTPLARARLRASRVAGALPRSARRPACRDAGPGSAAPRRTAPARPCLRGRASP